MAGVRPTPIHVLGGEPYLHAWYFLDGVTLAPLSQAGQTVQAQIRPYGGADELVVSFAVDLTNWVSQGLAMLSLTAAEADIVADRFSVDDPGAMDVQITTAGVPITYMEAAVTAKPDVTR